MAHSNNQTNQTGFITMGVTEEMQDSVHSLINPNRGYYEWKADHRSSTYNDGRQMSGQSGSQMNHGSVGTQSHKNSSAASDKMAQQM